MTTEKVRIHLENAILVGYGDEAKYAKVLVGERDTSPDGPTRPRRLATAFIISGFVRGYRDTTLARPTKMLLSDYNILAIEEVRVEQATRTEIEGCPQKQPHSLHTWQHSGSSIMDCPGTEAQRDSLIPKTVTAHAKRITNLVLFCVAYGSSRPGTALRVQEYLERHFRLNSETR